MKPRRPLKRTGLRKPTLAEVRAYQKRMAAKRKPLKKRNAKRAKSEFARCFHSRKRVQWFKATPCCWLDCGKTPTDNAHTAKDGMGLRGGYETIIPLCREHHRAYDERHHPFDNLTVRAYLAESVAPRYAQAWATLFPEPVR